MIWKWNHLELLRLCCEETKLNLVFIRCQSRDERWRHVERKKEKNAKASNDLFKFAVASSQPSIPANPISRPSRTSRTSCHLGLDTNPGKWLYHIFEQSTIFIYLCIYQNICMCNNSKCMCCKVLTRPRNEPESFWLRSIAHLTSLLKHACFVPWITVCHDTNPDYTWLAWAHFLQLKFRNNSKNKNVILNKF